jgi:hypothetical protein
MLSLATFFLYSLAFACPKCIAPMIGKGITEVQNPIAKLGATIMLLVL